MANCVGLIPGGLTYLRMMTAGYRKLRVTIHTVVKMAKITTARLCLRAYLQRVDTTKHTQT
jgi:hypothetical protein